LRGEGLGADWCLAAAGARRVRRVRRVWRLRRLRRAFQALPHACTYTRYPVTCNARCAGAAGAAGAAVAAWRDLI